MRSLLRIILIALTAATLCAHTARAQGTGDDVADVASLAGIDLPKCEGRPCKPKDVAGFIAVQAIVAAGNQVGVPITKEEAQLVTAMVGCLIGGNNSVGECGKAALIETVLKAVPDGEKYLGTFTRCAVGGGNVRDCVTAQVLEHIPEQARPLAKCIADGRNVADCSKDAVVGEIVARVPEQARPLVECVARGGDPADCAVRFAASKLPPEMKPLADCLAARTPVADCATKYAVHQIDEKTKQEIDQALETLKKLQADTDGAMQKDLPNAVRNAITLARGIRDDRWDLIIDAGGTELAKIVVSIILQYYLGPQFGPLIGKIVDVDIQNTHDSWKKIYNAAREGDLNEINKVVFEFTMTSMFQAPCALIPKGEFKDAVCGNMAKLVTAVSGVVADGTEVLLQLGKGFLEAVGIWQLGDKIVHVFGDAFDKIDELFGADKDKPKYQDPSVCGTAGDYYVKNYLACLTSFTDAKAQGPYSPVATQLTASCTANLGRCYPGADQSCQAMTNDFNRVADDLSKTVAQAANAFVTTAAPLFAAAHAARACDADFWTNADTGSDFISRCANALTAKFPWDNDRCTARLPLPKEAKAPWKLCQAALNSLDLNGMRQSMQSKCDAAKQAEARVNAFAANCIPVLTTADGKLFQQTGFGASQKRDLSGCFDTPAIAWLGVQGSRRDGSAIAVLAPSERLPLGGA